MRWQTMTPKQGQKRAVALRLREVVLIQVEKCIRTENCFKVAENENGLMLPFVWSHELGTKGEVLAACSPLVMLWQKLPLLSMAVD